MKKQELLKMLKELEERFDNTEFSGLFPVLEGIIRSCEVHLLEVCEGCGAFTCRYNATRDTSTHFLSPSFYCPSCRDEYLLLCETCGKYYHKDNMILDKYIGFMCPDCYRDRVYRCGYCDDYVHHTEAFWYEDTPCCDICYHHLTEE